MARVVANNDDADDVWDMANKHGTGHHTSVVNCNALALGNISTRRNPILRPSMRAGHAKLGLSAHQTKKPPLERPIL